MEKNIENMDFSGNRKKKGGVFRDGNKEQKQKESHHACCNWYCDCLHLCHRSFAKKAYDRHQEELRLQAIETKNSEIDEEYQRFEKEKTEIKNWKH